MAGIERYDAVVVGAGAAGKLMTWHLGALGKRVAVVERRYLGGSCPNVACMPSKNVIHTAKVASYLPRHAEFGLPRAPGPIDMARVRARKDEMVAWSRAVHAAKFERAGAEIVWGTGRFVEPRTVTVTAPGAPARTVQGDMVFLDTGSRALVDPIPGLREASPLTHVEALDLGELPRHLVVLGGSYVGLEFAQAFRRFGSRVTVVERSPRNPAARGPDVSAAVAEALAAEGVDVHPGVAVTRVDGHSGERVRLTGDAGGREVALEGLHLRSRPGASRTPRKWTPPPAAWRSPREGPSGSTSASRRPPTAWGDGRLRRVAVLHAHRRARLPHRARQPGGRAIGRHDGRLVPICLFTDPELARVGLSEQEAREKGIAYRVATVPMSANLRARTLSETRGFLKAPGATTIASSASRIRRERRRAPAGDPARHAAGAPCARVHGPGRDAPDDRGRPVRPLLGRAGRPSNQNPRTST